MILNQMALVSFFWLYFLFCSVLFCSVLFLFRSPSPSLALYRRSLFFVLFAFSQARLEVGVVINAQRAAAAAASDLDSDLSSNWWL